MPRVDMPRVEHVAAMNLRRSMINPSLRVTVIVASQTPDHLACRHRRDRNLNVGQTISRKLRYDVVTRKAKQPKFVRQHRRQRQHCSRVVSGRIVVANCSSEQKKALKWRTNSRLRARHLTAEACRYLRLTNSIAGTQADDLSAN